MVVSQQPMVEYNKKLVLWVNGCEGKKGFGGSSCRPTTISKKMRLMCIPFPTNQWKVKINISSKPPKTKKWADYDHNTSLVGGFNPFEIKWESSLNRDENKKHLKPPPRIHPVIILLWRSHHRTKINVQTVWTPPFPKNLPNGCLRIVFDALLQDRPR